MSGPTTERRFTVDELEQIVEAALRERDFPAVVAAIRLLAAQDAARAELLLSTIEVGLYLAGDRRDDA